MIFQIIKRSLRKGYLKKSFTNIPKLFCCHETCYAQLYTFAKHQSDATFLDENENWLQIYKLPIIPWAAAFNRLKIYQGSLTAIGIPVSYALESTSILPDHGTIVFSILGVTGLITLTLGSLAIQNLIGIIYINNKTDSLKLSYVDFWGQRKNVVLKIHDILPNYEQAPRKLDYYQTVTTNLDNGIKFKLLQRFGHISDRTIFTSIFGD